jgi:hypothetical protein
MTAHPQTTAQNHPKSPEFTLLGEFEDKGVIQQSNNRRTHAPAPAQAAVNSAISRLRRTLLPENASTR